MRREIQCLDAPIVLETVELDEGMLVCLTGGCRSHIGAVSTAEPEGTVRTQEFPGHRDQAISAPWAQRLASALGQRVTVVCGIHYDSATPEQIREILQQTDALLGELLETLE